MKIKFDENARAGLKEFMESRENKVIRLKVVAFGCGKPALGIVLDEQKEDDVVVNVKDIIFAVESKYEMYFQNTEILYNPKVYFDNGFYVHSVSSTSKGACR